MRVSCVICNRINFMPENLRIEENGKLFLLYEMFLVKQTT